MIKHKHHIIPRHAGGTDDANNIIELSVCEHAEAHKKLWEQYGRPEDKLAWQCLSGILTKEEIVKELCSLGGQKGGLIGGSKCKGRKQTTEHIEKRKVYGEKNGMYGKTHSDEVKQRVSERTRKMAQELGDNFAGTKNLRESVEKRMEMGLLPSQMNWTCDVCGVSGKGLSNYTRWHKNRCKK